MIYYQYSNFSQITLVKSSGPKEWENAWEPCIFRIFGKKLYLMDHPIVR